MAEKLIEALPDIIRAREIVRDLNAVMERLREMDIHIGVEVGAKPGGNQRFALAIHDRSDD